ncbi:Bre5p [Saccharomyces eubayanus]|uniref:Bre5p n=1 Tax=Saccharomyces eubayanus TaxID=1080349 RepID=UPI0006C663E4|nr:BRE5-like protein [Saccharomyces eubayanus]KOG97202.1 BRE5-like protein [Saccharomyces eubayanus]
MVATVQDICFAFLQNYYERMRTDPSKLAYFYASTAELTHTNYQSKSTNEKDDVLPTVKVTGRENINKFFSRNDNKVRSLKLKLDTIDFQYTGHLHKSILIIATGEMFWTGTPVYKFCQTFILLPSSSGSTFDITNDIIRFIPSSFKPYLQREDYLPQPEKDSSATTVDEGEKIRQDLKVDKEKEKENSPEVTKPKAKKEISKEPIVEPKPLNQEKPIADHNQSQDLSAVKESKNHAEGVVCEAKGIDKQNELLLQETIVKPDEKPPKSEKKAVPTKALPIKAKEASEIISKTPLPNSKVDNEEITVQEIVQESETEGKPIEPHSSETKESNGSVPALSPSPEPVANPPKMTWASKLMTENSDRISKNNSTVEYIRPETLTKKPSERKFEMGNRRDNASSSKNKKKPVFSTVNKDGFYPIYIRGTSGLREEKLRSALEKEFGKVMRITAADNFAVVDFETQKSQTDALEKKKKLIDGIEVCLERKTVKKPTGNNSPSVFPNGVRPHRKQPLKRKE